MNQIYTREACSEVLVCLDKNMGSRLCAIEEAIRILQKEAIRERTYSSHSAYRKPDNDKL